MDILANPIQSEDIGIHVDLRPKWIYPSKEECQSIKIDVKTKIPILYDGVLPYIPIRRTTPLELDSYERIQLISRDDLNHFLLNGSFS